MPPSRSVSASPVLCSFCKLETLGYFEDSEAKKLLENVAKCVQPIMKKRKWTVLLLSEFYPKNKSLYGLHINRGEQIKVRLREPEDVKVLLPFECVVGTVLHELAHFVYAKHDKHFYSLLDQLTLEYEGKGNFWSEGHRLGGRISKPHTNHEKRSLLAQAAEKRRNRSLLLGASQKLGGSSPDSTATPQQMAALAAIRRLEDNKWCGTLELLDQ
jgi:hypothetical protein